jgi:hypothetical protein
VQNKKSKFEVRSRAAKQRWVRDIDKEAFWRSHISAWKKSKLSIRQYCIINTDISESSFRSWRRELDLRDREELQPSGKTDKSLVLENPFVPIRLVTAGAADAPTPSVAKKSSLEIILRGSAVIRVDEGTDLAFVSKLLNALEAKDA